MLVWWLEREYPSNTWETDDSRKANYIPQRATTSIYITEDSRVLHLHHAQKKRWDAMYQYAITATQGKRLAVTSISISSSCTPYREFFDWFVGKLDLHCRQTIASIQLARRNKMSTRHHTAVPRTQHIRNEKAPCGWCACASAYELSRYGGRELKKGGLGLATPAK